MIQKPVNLRSGCDVIIMHLCTLLNASYAAQNADNLCKYDVIYYITLG